MSYDINNITIIGRLTADPMFSNSNDKNICKFSVANNRGKVVNFFNVVTFSRTAELCNQYLKKGSQICIIGELRNNRYQNKEGKNVSRDEIIANNIQFLSGNNQQQQQQPEWKAPETNNQFTEPF